MHNTYTADDIQAYEQYMQDVLDLNSYVQAKLNIYDQACIDMNKAFATVIKNKTNKSVRNKCISTVEAIWSTSKAKTMRLIKTKPHNAGAAIDNLLDMKKIIGNADEVKKEEATFTKALNAYQKFYRDIMDRWDTDGSERSKMMRAWNACAYKDNEVETSELEKLLAEYRKMDYLVDIIYNETNNAYDDNKSIFKAI